MRPRTISRTKKSTCAGFPWAPPVQPDVKDGRAAWVFGELRMLNRNEKRSAAQGFRSEPLFLRGRNHQPDHTTIQKEEFPMYKFFAFAAFLGLGALPATTDAAPRGGAPRGGS